MQSSSEDGPTDRPIDREEERERKRSDDVPEWRRRAGAGAGGEITREKWPWHYMVTGITRTQYRLKNWKSRITHKSLLGRPLTRNQVIKSLISAQNLHNWAKYVLKNLEKWQKPPRYSGGGAKSPSLIANLSLFRQFAIVDSYILIGVFWMSFQMSIVSICSAKLHPDFFNQTWVFLLILLLKRKILPQNRGIT